MNVTPYLVWYFTVRTKYVYQGLGRLGLADQERLPYFYEFHFMTSYSVTQSHPELDEVCRYKMYVITSVGPCNFSSATSARTTGVGSWCGVFAYAVVGLRVGFRVDGRVEGANV